MKISRYKLEDLSMMLSAIVERREDDVLNPFFMESFKELLEELDELEIEEFLPIDVNRRKELNTLKLIDFIFFYSSSKVLDEYFKKVFTNEILSQSSLLQNLYFVIASGSKKKLKVFYKHVCQNEQLPKKHASFKNGVLKKLENMPKNLFEEDVFEVILEALKLNLVNPYFRLIFLLNDAEEQRRALNKLKESNLLDRAELAKASIIFLEVKKIFIDKNELECALQKMKFVVEEIKDSINIYDKEKISYYLVDLFSSNYAALKEIIDSIEHHFGAELAGEALLEVSLVPTTHNLSTLKQLEDNEAQKLINKKFENLSRLVKEKGYANRNLNEVYKEKMRPFFSEKKMPSIS